MRQLTAPFSLRTWATAVLACSFCIHAHAAPQENLASSPSTADDHVAPPPHQPRLVISNEASEDRWSAHAQTTYVWQNKDAFYAPYTGPQSLSPKAEQSYTLTITGYFGARFWPGGELYVNPEIAEGMPLSHLLGMASMNNGEAQKNGSTSPSGYFARAFLRQVINLGGDTAHVEAGANQLASNYQSQRVVITLGKIAQTDIFEKNTYANDPRSQFLNWAMTTHGAWDYAADGRSYSIGGAIELYWNAWAFRAGRFMEPKVANGPTLNYNIGRYHGDTVEVEHDHSLGDQRGLVRVMAFRNHAFAGSYQDALELARQTGNPPDVAAVRKPSNKVGYGISMEQRVTDDIGLFLRASKANDQVEEYAFAEIDNTISGGVSLKGTRWNRADDTLGVAYATSGLNSEHRAYLAAGGMGGFLGDGQLPHYGREQVFEAYYNFQVIRGVHLSLDYQQITNPGYNTDRKGPVRILGGRIHLEI